VARWLVQAFSAAALLVIVLFFLLTRTDRGASVIVGQMLQRLPIAGEITATGSRTERLLEGVRLYGLTIRGDDGRPILFADSVQVGYTWRTLLSGDIVFDTLALWGPRATISRYPGEPEFNVMRLLPLEVVAADGAPARGKQVVFRGVTFRGGEARVLYPENVAPGGDSLLSSHAFVGVDGHFPNVVLQSRDSVGQWMTVEDLSFQGDVLADSVQVRGMKGQLRFVDARLDVDLDRLALERSEARGTAFVEFPRDGGLAHFGFDLNTTGLELADLNWLDARVGEGRAVGGVGVEVRGEELRVSFDAFQMIARDSDLSLDGGIVLNGEFLRFEDLDVEAAPFAIARVEPWLAKPLPLSGSVEGTAVLDGTLAELRSSGRVTLLRSGPDEDPITAEFSGTVHLADGFGFTDLRAILDPFDFGVLETFASEVRLQGVGRVTVEASGRASDSILFTAGISHRPTGLPASEVDVQGSVEQRGGSWAVDIRANAQPLSLTALARDYPSLPLTGEVSGSFSVNGPLSDLSLETDLSTEGGHLGLGARFDVTNPGAHYAIQGQVADFALSRVVTAVPAPTVISGIIDIEGRGTDYGSLTLDARARLRPSRVGKLSLDTAAVKLRVRGGRLFVDTLDAVLGGVLVRGLGTLAMESEGPVSSVIIAFESDSLGRLRSLALGDEVIARDTLTELDRELLRVQGVDPDSLPTRAEVELTGAVQGRVTVTGSVQEFVAQGNASFAHVRYGKNVVRGVEVSFEGASLPRLDGRLAVSLEADSLFVVGLDFVSAHLGLERDQAKGSFDVVLGRRPGEDHTFRGVFTDEVGKRSVQLDELALRFDEITWALERPAVIAWNDHGFDVRDFDLHGPGDSLRIKVDGLIPREGPADLMVSVQDLHLENLARLVQQEELGLTGRLALNARLTGTATSPLIVGDFDTSNLTFRTFSMTRFAGAIDYADRTLRLSLGAWQDSLRALTASGLVPVDLAFYEMDRRVPVDRQMDLNVIADSLPAVFVLGPLGGLSDVAGTISGQFHIVGTVNDPSPTGTVALRDAAWTLDALGVRHRDVGGTLTLNPDATVDVDMAGRAGGAITTSGTVTLLPLTDPDFDLQIKAENFQAVTRPDMEARLTGEVALTGTYSRPVVRSLDGRPVRVEEGTLYVEEFRRTVGVVDLADPAFFAVVDTSVANPRRLLGVTANPFLRNLRADVDLVSERNSSLRSDQMNVEMGGELQVVYDRQSGDLAMLGALEAIRGTYSILGRSFQVASGTIEFVGTPGINPILNIVASTRVRQARTGGSGNDNLSIQATVSGTLSDPRVSLTGDEGAIAESDLVSYLVFGVPSYQLATGQAAQVQDASQSLLGTTVGAGLSILQGTLASRLSSLVARGWGLDHFAILQPKELGLSSLDVAGTLASTTFEVGWYLEQDVFVTLLLTPLAGQAGTGTNPFGGARLDWVLSPNWTLQSFYEDRYLRQPTLGFDQQIMQSRKVGGLFLFRDWGYHGTERAPAPSASAPP